jgi:hypothetical protein
VSDVITHAKAETHTQYWVQVRGQAYGPYGLDQLARFVEEGRIRPATPVSERADGGWVEARRVPGLLAPLVAPSQEHKVEPVDELGNVVVFAEIFSGAWPRFMAAIEGLGPVCEMAPGLWIVRTRFSAGVVRNTLSQTLDRGDRFVVVDATRDRLAWFNLGPEVDVKINKVWNAKTK